MRADTSRCLKEEEREAALRRCVCTPSSLSQPHSDSTVSPGQWREELGGGGGGGGGVRSMYRPVAAYKIQTSLHLKYTRNQILTRALDIL